MTIVYRQTKGSDLYPSEVDGNFADLDLRTKSGWRDLICGLDTRSGPQSPVLTNYRNGIYLYGFSNTVNQEVFATAHIDHDYKLGTMLYPHMHWTADTIDTGVVRWGFEYTFARRSDSTPPTTFDPTTIIYVEQTATGVAYTHYVAEVAEGQGIPGTYIEPDTLILFRIFRDAEHVNDTYEHQVFGFTFDLHYEADRYATPSRSPNFYV